VARTVAPPSAVAGAAVDEAIAAVPPPAAVAAAAEEAEPPSLTAAPQLHLPPMLLLQRMRLRTRHPSAMPRMQGQRQQWRHPPPLLNALMSLLRLLIGKPNRMFAWFVINYLLMCILFDTFIEHRSLVAPMPFKNVPLSEENISMLMHNKQILIKFCLSQGNSTTEKYFVNKKTSHVGTGCLDLDKLWSTSTKFHRQFNAGIRDPSIVSSLVLFLPWR